MSVRVRTVGVPGEPITPEDLAFAHEQPLHQFLIGETVAVPGETVKSHDDNGKTYIYGTQPQDSFNIDEDLLSRLE